MKGRDTPIQISVSPFLRFTEMLVGQSFELRPFGTEYVDSISPAMSLQLLPSRSLCAAKLAKNSGNEIISYLFLKNLNKKDEKDEMTLYKSNRKCGFFMIHSKYDIIDTCRTM